MRAFTILGERVAAADVATLNVRLRYNFAEGNDLWVVYGYVANTDNDAASPVLP